MTDLTLDAARKIVDAALAKGLEKKLNPLAVAVLDARGCLKAFAAQDGTSLKRGEIAHGKAYGALSLGMGSRAIFKRAQEQAYFISALCQQRSNPPITIESPSTSISISGSRPTGAGPVKPDAPAR